MSQTQFENIILKPLRIDVIIASIILGITGIIIAFFDQLFLGFIFILVAIFQLVLGKNYYLKISDKTISILSFIPKSKSRKKVGLNDVNWFSVRYYIHNRSKIIVFRINIDNKRYTFFKSDESQLKLVFNKFKELGYEFYKREEDGSFNTDYYQIKK